MNVKETGLNERSRQPTEMLTHGQALNNNTGMQCLEQQKHSCMVALQMFWKSAKTQKDMERSGKALQIPEIAGQSSQKMSQRVSLVPIS